MSLSEKWLLTALIVFLAVVRIAIENLLEERLVRKARVSPTRCLRRHRCRRNVPRNRRKSGRVWP